VVRGLAVLEALGHGLLVGPPGWEKRAASCGVRYAAAPVPEGLDAVRAFLAELPVPALRLVDVFPRGPADELRDVFDTSAAWLVARRVQPERYRRRAHEIAAFEQVVWCEAADGVRSPVACSPRSDREQATPGLTPIEVGPVLRATPRLTRAEARRVLGVEGERPLVLGLAAGSPALQGATQRVLQRAARIVGADLRFVDRAWPAAPLLAGADVAVVSGGYHAVHEVRAAGVPAVIVPQARPWDDQPARAEAARTPHRHVARSPEELVDALRLLIQARPGLRPEVLPDGAAQLAALVERRVQAGVLGEEEIAPMA
jgi:hypothetical protein